MFSESKRNSRLILFALCLLMSSFCHRTLGQLYPLEEFDDLPLINDIIRFDSETLFIATGTGGFLFKDDTLSSPYENSPLASAKANVLRTSPVHDLLIGTYESSLIQIKPGTSPVEYSFSDSFGLEDFQIVTNMFPGQKTSEIWALTAENHMIKYAYKRNQFYTYKLPIEFDVNDIYVNDKIWLATEDGIYSKKKKKWVKESDFQVAYKIFEYGDHMYIMGDRSKDQTDFDFYNFSTSTSISNFNQCYNKQTVVNDVDIVGDLIMVGTNDGAFLLNMKNNTCNRLFNSSNAQVKVAIQNSVTFWALNSDNKLIKAAKDF